MLKSLVLISHPNHFQTDFITPEIFGEILYENFLFDMPKIMDICVLYGKQNGPLVSKMVENIFSKQEGYHDDLRQIVPAVLKVNLNFLTKSHKIYPFTGANIIR